jgi:hypothetical protein
VNDRVTLLGTRDGFIMRMYDAAGSDDTFGGVTSYVYIGPYTGDTLSDQTMEWLDVVLGEPATIHHDSDFNVVVQMRSGPTPEVAFERPAADGEPDLRGRVPPAVPVATAAPR